jgi:hypothetical protein
MRVKSKTEIRFERRWEDYCQVVQEGTPKVVGKTAPRPPDFRGSVMTALGKGDPNWQAAHDVLDQVWAKDARHWRRRLEQFLEYLSGSVQSAFADLVEAGCQPDMLAFQFHEATQLRRYEKDRGHVRRELEELDKLGHQAVDAVTKFANRKKQFDTYLMSHRLAVVEGELGDAELKMLVWDLEDLVARHVSDNARMRRQIDARRNPLLGHAEVRLSRRVHAATGAYRDGRVEQILEEIRQRMGYEGRAPGTLKKRRQRWTRQLDKRAPAD